MFPLLCGGLHADFLPVFRLQASNALPPLHGSITPTRILESLSSPVYQILP